LFIKPGVVGHASTSELACTICWFLYHSSTHTDAFSGSLVSSHSPRCSFRGTLPAAKLWKIYAHSPLSFPFPHDLASLRRVHSHIPNSLGEPSSAFFNPHSAFAYISSFELREPPPHTPQQPPFSHSQLSSRLSRDLVPNSYPWLSRISSFKFYTPSSGTNSILLALPSSTQTSTTDPTSKLAIHLSRVYHLSIYLCIVPISQGQCAEPQRRYTQPLKSGHLHWKHRRAGILNRYMSSFWRYLSQSFERIPVLSYMVIDCRDPRRCVETIPLVSPVLSLRLRASHILLQRLGRLNLSIGANDRSSLSSKAALTQSNVDKDVFS
jgi:hypothetical protein